LTEDTLLVDMIYIVHTWTVLNVHTPCGCTRSLSMIRRTLVSAPWSWRNLSHSCPTHQPRCVIETSKMRASIKCLLP